MNKAIAIILASFMITMGYQACQNFSVSQPGTSGLPKQIFTMQGGVDGGGGKGVQCGEEVMTLDLFEAKQRGLTPLAPQSSIEENLIYFGTRLARYYSENRSEFSLESTNSTLNLELLKLIQKEIIGQFSDIPNNNALPLTQDATIPMLPSSCAIVQIAIYHKNGIIYRDRNLWEKLSLNDQTALILHESIYLRARSYGAIDSDESRMLVGRIFSGTEQPLFEPLWDASPRLVCMAGIQGTDQEIYEFLVADDHQQTPNGTHFSFKGLKNTYVTWRTTAFLPNLSTNDLINGTIYEASMPIENKETGETWKMELKKDPTNSNRLLIRTTQAGKSFPPYSSVRCEWL